MKLADRLWRERQAAKYARRAEKAKEHTKRRLRRNRRDGVLSQCHASMIGMKAAERRAKANERLRNLHATGLLDDADLSRLLSDPMPSEA
jgi:hypothetical protein